MARSLLHLGSLLAGFLVLLALFYLLQPIVMPCAVALVIAYLLNPCVEWLVEKCRLSRVSASLLMVLSTALLLFVGIVLLIEQMTQLANYAVPKIQHLAPQYTNQVRAMLPNDVNSALNGKWSNVLSNIDTSTVQESWNEISQRALPLLGALLTGAQTAASTLASLVTFFLFMPFMAFYFLAEWTVFWTHTQNLLPRRYVAMITDVVQQIDDALSSYLRGQTLVCVVQALYYTIALWAVGVPYALLIGVISGCITFIPYVGASMAWGAASVTSTLLNGFDVQQQLFLIGAFIVGQLLEGYVWVPRLVGNSVGLHPAWAMIALIVMGDLFGFMGLLLAMPVAAMIVVLVRVCWQYYRQSSYYQQKAQVIDS